jgi:hypothetical protein
MSDTQKYSYHVEYSKDTELIPQQLTNVLKTIFLRNVHFELVHPTELNLSGS